MGVFKRRMVPVIVEGAGDVTRIGDDVREPSSPR